MTLTPKQESIVNAALENIDRFPSEKQAAVWYACDQLVEGASPEYHGGERPDRDPGEAAMLVDGLVRALERIDVVLIETTPNGPRTWDEA